jgi:hypothetical protein
VNGYREIDQLHFNDHLLVVLSRSLNPPLLLPLAKDSHEEKSCRDENRHAHAKEAVARHGEILKGGRQR